MKQGLWIILLLYLCACANPKIHSDKVFTNAQILYQEKKHNANNKNAALQMPSYFLDLEYSNGQIQLNPTQVNKVNAMMKKLDYPDEYRIYASLGAGSSDNEVANLAKVLKRGTDLKKRYGSRVKEVKVAYLKNQKPDSVYIRILG